LAYQGDYSTSAYPAFPFDDDSAESEISSDNDSEELPDPGVPQMSQAEAREHIYVQCRKATRTWRSFTGKPVRKFRRHIHRVKKMNGQDKGKSRGFMWTRDDALAYLNERGKGGRSSSSGKSFGRRKNPKDRAGSVVKRRVCDSGEHFAARNPKGKGKGTGASGFVSFIGVATPGDGRSCAEVSSATFLLEVLGTFVD
jgi:hypothetical protein